MKTISAQEFFDFIYEHEQFRQDMFMHFGATDKLIIEMEFEDGIMNVVLEAE